MSEKLKLFKVKCQAERCNSIFYIFRRDGKHPVEDIKCIDCELKEREKALPTRFLMKNGSKHSEIAVGTNDEADKPLVRMVE